MLQGETYLATIFKNGMESRPRSISTEYKLTIFLFAFLSQARAGHRPTRAWFLKIDPVRVVGMCVRVCVCLCVSAPEAINN